MLQNPASEELLDHLADYRAPAAPTPSEALIVDRAELFEVILDKPVER